MPRLPPPARDLHGDARLPRRAGVRGAVARGRRPARAAAGDGGAQGRGPPPGTVEPVPPRARPGRRRARPEQRRVRPAGGADGPQPAGARGVQLLGPRHGQHGGAHAVRHRRAEGSLAAASARRRDPLGVRHDRARRRQLRRDEHPPADRARRRRLRPQRPQVVDHERAAPALPRADRHGGDRPERRAPPPPEPDPRAARHARAPGRPRAAGVRVPGPGGPRGARVRRRAGAGSEPDRRTRATAS